MIAMDALPACHYYSVQAPDKRFDIAIVYVLNHEGKLTEDKNERDPVPTNPPPELIAATPYCPDDIDVYVPEKNEGFTAADEEMAV